MKYGPITHRKNVDAVLHLRTVDRLSGPAIAKKTGIPLSWVTYQLKKFDLHTRRWATIGSAHNLEKAAELRAQGLPWKTVAKRLGVERWQTLARAHYVANR